MPRTESSLGMPTGDYLDCYLVHESSADHGQRHPLSGSPGLYMELAKHKSVSE